MHIPGWETPQTILGNVVSHARNMTGNVDNVEVGLNYVLVNDRDGDRMGMTLRPYINSQGIWDDYTHDPLFIHEFGHTIQSKFLGPLYLKKVGVPSLLSQGMENVFGEDFHGHDRAWFEINANQLGQTFYTPNYTSARHRAQYPTSIGDLDWWFLLFNPFIF
jgi:hypothetical protein